MKNFLILLSIFFLIFLMVAFLSVDSMFIFFFTYLALIISGLCLIAYVGRIRGILLVAIFAIFPFLLEYLLYSAKLPFFTNATIIYLSTKAFILPITTANLNILISIPALFIGAIFFSQKMRLWFHINKAPKVFLIISACLLCFINFLNPSLQNIIYKDAVKWLIISLITYILAIHLIKFKPETPDFFKEIPIMIFLLLYSYNFVLTSNYFFLLILSILLLIYLLTLYSEHRYHRLLANQAPSLDS